MTGAIPDPSNPYTTSYALYQSLGWQGVIPVAYLDKAPPPDGFTGFDGKWPTKGRAERWASDGPQNMALRLPDDVIGVDVDNYAKLNKRGVRVVKNGAAQLAEFEAKHGKLPPTWSSTKRDPTGASRIHFYRVPPGTVFPESIAADIDIIQFGHRYAVVYPSVMPDEEEDGEFLLYSWFDPNLLESQVPPRPEDLTLLPQHLIEAMQATGPPKARESEGKTAKSKGLGLYLPPDDPGRTNEWLSKVAGRLAIAFRHSRDEYLEFVKLIDSSSTDPHGMADLEKTALSVWKREQGKQVPGAGTEYAGYLYCQSGKLVLDDKDGETQTFGTFDMRVVGKVRSSDGEIDGYDVLLTNDRTKRVSEQYLPMNVLTDARRLQGWLVRREVAIVTGTIPGQAPPHTRLALYLSAQPARDIRVTSWWGWDDQAQGFVTDKGIIRATGLDVDRSIRPNPGLTEQQLVTHNYGFEFDEDRTRAILREILTFQDETVTSVVGAWWMATKLKGQIMQAASMFPVMVIEAPAESGKSKGFFEYMYKLDGNTREQSVPTYASFRNRMSAHRNGYVWLDDPKEVSQNHLTVIRTATGEKEFDKTSAADFQTNTVQRMVAPVMLSGEGFGFGHEKATSDRTIRLPLPDPKQRRSLHNPDRLQWDDIMDFKVTYPDLTMAAGTLTAMALQHAGEVLAFADLRVGSGRHADKMAVLRVGARVLAAVTGDPSHIARVDTWCGAQVNTGNENALTLELIPTVLTATGLVEHPRRISKAPLFGLAHPVIVGPDKNGVQAVWVNVGTLAAWWAKHDRNADVRVHSEKALADQARTIGMVGQKAGTSGIDWKRPEVKDENGTTVTGRLTYQRVPDAYAATWLADHHTSPGDSPLVVGGVVSRATRLAERGPNPSRSSPPTPENPL